MTQTSANELPATLPETLIAYASEYEGWDAERLIGELRRLAGVTVDTWARMAVLYRCVEAAGHDAAAVVREVLGTRMTRVLQKVADGQVLPELAAKCSGQSTLYRRASALPLSEQRVIAADQPVPVVVKDDDGWTHRRVRPSQMSEQQIQIVFAGDHLRDESEQRTVVERLADRSPRAKAGPYVLNVKRQTVRITEPCELTVSDLLEIQRQLMKR